MLNTEVQYKVGQRVWIEYPLHEKRRGTIIKIKNDDITVNFKYWGTEMDQFFRDFQISPFTYDNYVEDFEFAMRVLKYDLVVIESYLRKIKLLKINKVDSKVDVVTEIDEVLGNFDAKYIEGYVARIKMELNKW